MNNNVPSAEIFQMQLNQLWFRFLTIVHGQIYTRLSELREGHE